MIIRRLLLLLFGISLASCANPGQSYASKHPELSEPHRQILSTGKITQGNSVAGMTREEVKLAMHGAPAVFDKINGEDAWIYLRKKEAPMGDPQPQSTSPGTRSNGPVDLRSASAEPEMDVNLKTTIFFQGDRATRAEVSQEKR